MSHFLDSKYQSFKQRVVDFATNELNGDLVKRDLQGVFDRSLWERCASFGIQNLCLPKKYGGPEETVNLFKAIKGLEGFSKGCSDNGLTLALSAQMWTVTTTILHFGNNVQKNKWLPGLGDGSLIGAHALTEAESGSDAFSLRTTATADGDDFILNGEKWFVTLAPVCDLAIVFANANPKYGHWGVTAFIVDTKKEGCILGDVQSKMGLRTVPIGSIKLNNYRASSSDVLGKVGGGVGITNASLEYDRCLVQATQIGVMERQIEAALSFAQNRSQFGQNIGEFQSVSNRIADMKLRLESSRALLYRTVEKIVEGQNVTLDSALTKLSISESVLKNSEDLVRIHGGRGYLSEYGIEREVRDAFGGIIYAGTSDIQRNIIFKLLNES